jgi:hypothetical protein
MAKKYYQLQQEAMYVKFAVSANIDHTVGDGGNGNLQHGRD